MRNLAVMIGGYERREAGLMPYWLLCEEIADYNELKSGRSGAADADDDEDII